jgi:uncharacterized protein YgiM (DUF1202 family)
MNASVPPLTRCALALLLGAGLVLTGAAPSQADRGEARHDVVVVKTLPRGYHTVHVRGGNYYEHAGRYYQRRHDGYAQVPAPRGAVVVSLPLGNVRLTVGSQVYFHAADVYYQPVRGGYRVVAPPRATPRPLQIMVKARHLNAHAGPGAGYAVVSRLHGGTKLIITGRAPGWYRVDLGSGHQGWIKSSFTATVRGD